MTIKAFQTLVFDFYKKHARRDLPWRKTRDPWPILVSEVMLQQTQVSRVEAKFREFMRLFPTPHALARASTKKVLREWQGLGYNRRVLNLQKAARMIVEDYGGVVPPDPELLDALPGIGHYTANAVAAFAFNKPVVFLDTNIRRVYIHHFFSSGRHPKFNLPACRTGRGSRNKNKKIVIASDRKGAWRSHPDASNEIASRNARNDNSVSFGFSVPFWVPGQARNDGEEKARKVSDAELLPLIQKTLYRKNPRLWYSALMDYGALGDFGENPNRKSAQYVTQPRFEGSRRFVRAKIVKFLLEFRRGKKVHEIEECLRGYKSYKTDKVYKTYNNTSEVLKILEELEREGFLENREQLWRVKR